MGKLLPKKTNRETHIYTTLVISLSPRHAGTFRNDVGSQSQALSLSPQLGPGEPFQVGHTLQSGQGGATLQVVRGALGGSETALCGRDARQGIGVRWGVQVVPGAVGALRPPPPKWQERRFGSCHWCSFRGQHTDLQLRKRLLGQLLLSRGLPGFEMKQQFL